jgi:hypothetical protein
MINRRLGARFAMAGLMLFAGAALTGPAIADSDDDDSHHGSGHSDRDHDRDSNKFDIRTLSNRADLISGGDALVEVKVPRRVDLNDVVISLNGTNITAAFIRNSAARTFRGLVTGLHDGRNVLQAGVRGRDHDSGDSEKLTITNHPIGGPVLLSSQTQPWVCATPTLFLGSGNTPASNASGLTTFAIDAQCNIATEFKLFYRTKTPVSVTPNDGGCSLALPDPSPTVITPNPTRPANPCFRPYVPGTTDPASIASTTTNADQIVPYVVRIERGTLNRGIYEIAVLFDTTKTWTALSPQPQWNGKAVYSFGASTGQPRLQFRTEQSWVDDAALSRGFMVVNNSLTDSLFNSNRVLNAETLMMMKEHIIDTYGEIKYLLGNGCSGGSIQQNTAASIFPGLLDGIQPSCDYPDSITTGMEVTDCVLLVNVYAGPAWTTLMDGKPQAEINAKKAAINGHISSVSCQSWNNAFGFNNKPGNYARTLILPADTLTGKLTLLNESRNNCLLPAALVYDPLNNPNGTRCGDPDLATAVWGTIANENASGSVRARQTGDNVGIQYGLNAMVAGAITPEEFVTLNEKIGGVDADSNRRAARSTADRAALEIAYRAGIVSSGANLGKLPIIDSRGWDETGIHYIWRSFAERARIEEANHGNHGNQVMWRYGTGLLPGTAAQVAAVTVKSLVTMDTWLTNLNASAPKETINSVRTQAQVIAVRPAAAVDLCFLSTDPTFSTPVFNMAQCDADLPQADGLGRMAKRASPRQVAGGPLVENILKCQLKPLNSADYAPVILSSEQLGRLHTVFPDGVCDWDRPGVGQRPAASPLTFEDGPGGKRLPRAPESD